MLTPDGSFSPASLAVSRRPAPRLDRMDGDYSPGIYMARDWRSLSKSEFPMLVGGHDSFTWGELEPMEGAYDWRRLDDMIAANDATGKRSAFGITTYNGRIEGGIVAPTWLVNGFPETTIDCGNGWKIPRYWHSTYQTKYRNFVSALADRYKNDDRVAWTQIGVGLYGEIQPADDDGTRGHVDTTCVINALKSDFGSGVDQYQKWIDTINQITDSFMQNFTTGKPTFLVYTPSFVNANEKCYSTLYGASAYNGFGLFLGGIYANQPGIFNAWPNITYPYNCQKWDPILYWNNSPTATVPIAMESYRYMLRTMDDFYWGILNGLNKHPDYFNLESDLFFNNGDPNQKITENFPMMYFSNQYLGATINTTPNVWVAMREYDPATNGFGFHNNYVKPQWGNYDFWLYQDYNIAGGRTISATTVSFYSDTNALVWRSNPFYDPILAGRGPQGWTTRRTSHATGNDYVYLDVDDEFVAARGLQHSATVTVTWFDVITNTGTTWALQYKDTGGNVQLMPVQRHDTRQWQTSTFDITGADFSSGWSGSSRSLDNLRIYNGGTADLYVHFVMVGPLNGPTPTPTATITPGGPTLTPTGTGTVTPTPTGTNTPRPEYHLRINAGDSAYIDSGGQTWRDDQAYTAGSWGWYTRGGASSTYCTGSPISSTADPALYQCERYWTSSGGYTATVPNGSYYVQLRFAEIYETEPNRRTFGVNIQGVNVISNLDLVASAGPLTAYDRTFQTQVTNGLLHIEFAGTVGTAKVNAIHIFSVGGATATATATRTATNTPIAAFDCSAVSQIPLAECQALVALYSSTNGAGWRLHENWLANNTPCTWHGVTCAAGHVSALAMYNNDMSGSLPPELGNLANLKSLVLAVQPSYGGGFGGGIPPELGNLANLQHLNLYGNHLGGGIPPELGNLANLQVLDLSWNNLSGAIPPHLSNLAHLQTLDLAWNELSGAIPPELGDLSNLQALTLNVNQLSGALPLSLINLHLTHFYFQSTSLCEPADLAFQAWLAGIPNLIGTNDICGSGSPTVTPTATPTATATRTPAATPVSSMCLPVILSTYSNQGWDDHRTGNVNLTIDCKYKVTGEASYRRDCDNTSSWTPKINVADGAVNETVHEYPHAVAVTANSSASLSRVNGWFFGCDLKRGESWSRTVPIYSQNVSLTYDFDCSKAWSWIDVAWQPAGGGPSHPLTGALMSWNQGATTITPSYPGGYETQAGAVWAGETYLTTAGRWTLTATLPADRFSAGCWDAMSKREDADFLTSPNWLQHDFKTFTFYRSSDPSCVAEPPAIP